MNEEMADFNKWMLLKGVASSTLQVYNRCLRAYYASGQDTMAYLAGTVSLRTATKNVYKAALKALFRYRGEQPDIDPDLLAAGRPTNQKRVLIDRERILDIVASTRPHWNAKSYIRWRDHLMVEMLVYTGVRPKELSSITLDDIKPDKVWIHGIKREDGGYVYPPERVMADIRRVISLGRYGSGADRLFQLSPKHLSRIVRVLTGYAPRNFRTTFGTEVAMATRDPYMVQKLMRHRKLESSIPYVLLGQEYGKQIKEVKLYE